MRAVMLFLWAENDLGRMCYDVSPLHVNAKSHTARQTKELLKTFCWKIWNKPPYSLDLTLSDYFIFLKLRDHLYGTRFYSESNLKVAAESWLDGLRLDFCQERLKKIVLRSDKCLNRSGVHVEIWLEKIFLTSFIYILSNENIFLFLLWPFFKSNFAHNLCKHCSWFRN